MENPKIRFKGFTKDGNSVSLVVYWKKREIRQYLRMKTHCFLVPLMVCISIQSCSAILEVHQILDI